MSLSRSQEQEMGLLERRNKSLQESRERTQRLYEKAAKLGLIEIYQDHQGRIQTKKETK